VGVASRAAIFIPMKPTALAQKFNVELDQSMGNKQLRDGISTVLQMGDSLWLANDESASLERLTLAANGTAAADHCQFQLHRGTRQTDPRARNRY
jgi:Protein of unknown function (DUF3616)